MPQQPPVCTIGPAARVTGVPPWKLRAWETAGFLRPRRSSGGYRLYEQTDLEHIIWLRDVEARYGRLGVHAMAQAPPPKHAAEKPPGAGEGSHRALTAALRACRTAAGASWCGLIWRGPDARMAIVAADGRTRSAESALSPQEQREWERVVLSFQPAPPLPALTPFAPEQLDALLVRVGRSRGAIVLAQARTALDAGASQLAVRAVEAAVDVAALDRRGGRLQQRMSAIRALGRALARHRELRPLLQEAVERLASDTGMEAALIALVDRAERRLIVEAARGVSPAFVAGIRDWKVDEG
ncbi:MAG TPA: MerR family DNA-binding transcriptional regulator, partial [Solirubrobacter sp.]|nr:MerR family DNA-binding transcriptional regulator [Solirubrobacter sp.]